MCALNPKLAPANHFRALIVDLRPLLYSVHWLGSNRIQSHEISPAHLRLAQVSTFRNMSEFCYGLNPSSNTEAWDFNPAVAQTLGIEQLRRVDFCVPFRDARYYSSFLPFAASNNREPLADGYRPLDTRPTLGPDVVSTTSASNTQNEIPSPMSKNVDPTLAADGSQLRTDPRRTIFSKHVPLDEFGQRNNDGSWRCAWPHCRSRARFVRVCDLRKHYKRHEKTRFCRHPACPCGNQSGFSSEKDRERHEARHNPTIACTWQSCERLFSRLDNMVSPSSTFK